jgi:hypothetical protein
MHRFNINSYVNDNNHILTLTLTLHPRLSSDEVLGLKSQALAQAKTPAVWEGPIVDVNGAKLFGDKGAGDNVSEDLLFNSPSELEAAVEKMVGLAAIGNDVGVRKYAILR